jgi:iron complex transport system permease protein
MTIARRIAITWTVFGIGAALVCLFAPLVGSTSINLGRVFDSSTPFADNIDAQIFFVARLPRVLAGAAVGSALAASGVVLQALLRNPLATPFTLGVSAGAALGAMLALTFELESGIAGVSAVPVASFAGALGAVAIVYALARARHRGLSTNVLLLAGVTLNSFFSALILFVQFLSDYSQTFRTVRWLMGDLDVSSYGPLLASVRRYRWAVPSDSSVSSSRILSACSSAPIIAWCFPLRRLAAPRFSLRATHFRGRRCPQSRFRSASLRRS